MAALAASPSVDGNRPKSLLEVSDSFFDDTTLYTSSTADRHGISGSSPVVAPQPRASEVPKEIPLQGTMNKWSCNTCGNLEFASLDEQRSHFKSDFHRLNVKRKLVGKESISEKEFEQLADQRDDDVSSISGSEEESSSDEEAEIPTLLDNKRPRSSRDTRIALWLHRSDEIACIWKYAVLKDREKICRNDADSGSKDEFNVSENEVIQRLRAFVSRKVPDEKHIWIILLSSGGHFAGCVVDAQSGSILAHKTHHRYVVRAKAGGRQSTKDATGRAPKSAGASLRRYNEASLQKEIKDVLLSWKSYIQAASRIFVHAPSRNNQAFFGGDDASLDRTDSRLSRVPIMTRRPTFKETKRVFSELLNISYTRRDSLETINVDNILKTNDSKPVKEIPVTSKAPLEKEQESDTHQVCDGVVNLKSTSTVLHNAAQEGNANLVLELLMNGCNPCLKDERGHTPYIVAVDKDTRNAFRKFMAAHMEMWDWHAANVPSPLTEEMEMAQTAKQAEKDAKRKAKAKELKKLRKQKQKAREQAESNQNLAEAASKSPKLQQNPKPSSMSKTPKDLAALEREKRAAAAEKRILAMSRGTESTTPSSSNNSSDGCSYCGVSLENVTPFHKLSYKYCSTVCVNAHRVALMSL